MKLTTDIKPRKDGTVLVSAGNTAYKFTADASGMLVADVKEEDVGTLLDTGNFYPADEVDIEAGIAAVDESGEAGDDGDAPKKRGRKAS